MQVLNFRVFCGTIKIVKMNSGMEITMKKGWIKKICIFAVSFAFSVLLSIGISAAGNASLTGSSNIRAGDTVTLTFNISGTDIYGFTASLDYDSSKLTLTGTAQKIAAPWIVEFSSGNILAYDNNQTNPISSSKAVFTATFKISSSLSEGDTVSVRVKNIVASSGSSDIAYGDATYSAKLLGARSSNAELSSLKIANVTLSPAFSPSVYKYTATVPYSVSSVSVTAKTSDAGASYSVSGKNLSVGKNTVKVTVTASDGTKNVYTITITREQDPNYVPSSDALLSGISVSDGKLSPVFSPDIKTYIVYLPFEVESITINAETKDKNASGPEEIKSDLNEGDNVFELTCTAEDGVNHQTYTVHVYRMPQFDGTVPSVESAADTSDTTDETAAPETDLPDTASEETQPQNADSSKNINSTYYFALTIAAVLVSIAIGFIIGLLSQKKKNK